MTVDTFSATLPAASTKRAEDETGRPVRAAIIVALAGAGTVGMAHLAGAPLLVDAAIVAFTVGAIAVFWAAFAGDRRRASAHDEHERRSLSEIETLADRMWELQESEERLLGLIDALGDLVVHRDREGRIVYANRVLADLSDRDGKLLPGRTLPELGIEVGLVPDAAFADGECLSSKDVLIQTSDGPRWFSWIELSVRDHSSQTVSHRAIARDITARKRAEIALNASRERAEQASQAKSRFLATVSHEIRTPMNGMMGMAKLLADTKLTQEQRTYVGAISTSSTALMALIDDLLDFSKIEAGKFDIEPQSMHPRELVENVVELLADRAFGKSIGLGCHIAPDVPTTMISDPGRLRQVLLNLVGNAIKFTDSGGVAVHATMSRLGERPALKLAVRDTGPGLGREDLERIFEEFEQADGTSTRKHGGVGLGLAISRRIVEAMDGRIHVESTPGRGSEFSVLVPAAEAEPAAVPASPALLGHRTLVLSGNAMEAEALGVTLAAHGAEVEIARTPDEAVARCDDGRRFNSVFIDAASDTTAGPSLKRLRDAGLVDGQAFILVAPSERGRLAEYRAAGYASFLARPVRGSTLLRMLLSPPKEEAKPGAQSTLPNARRANRRGLSILLAEDNEINALLARTALIRAGHDVTVVGNGKAAVDAVISAETARYDVVLMDLHMPVLDGLDAIDLIRRHEAEIGSPPMPIMVLTADGQESTRHHVLAHGASGFVTKPIDPDGLLVAVKELAA